MLKIVVPEREIFVQKTNEFIRTNPQVLNLEHSLISLSKWESKWHVHFIGNKKITNEQMIDYIRCMTINTNVDNNVYSVLNKKDMKDISEYINDPMTATTVNDRRKPGSAPSREITTSEVLYYQMIQFGIPFECEKWHLNRLLMLIKVCAAYSSPKKNMSKSAIARQYSQLNNARRAAMHTKG